VNDCGIDSTYFIEIDYTEECHKRSDNYLFWIAVFLGRIGFINPMLTSPIDNILVEKAKRQMHLRNGDSVVKTYRISLGKNVGF
jgi:hypothetical protein